MQWRHVVAFCGVLLRGSCACRTAPARRAGLVSFIMSRCESAVASRRTCACRRVTSRTCGTRARRQHRRRGAVGGTRREQRGKSSVARGSAAATRGRRRAAMKELSEKGIIRCRCLCRSFINSKRYCVCTNSLLHVYGPEHSRTLITFRPQVFTHCEQIQ